MCTHIEGCLELRAHGEKGWEGGLLHVGLGPGGGAPHGAGGVEGLTGGTDWEPSSSPTVSLCARGGPTVPVRGWQRRRACAAPALFAE